MRQVDVTGVGMTRFTTPKNSSSYHEMGVQAIRAALDDAGINFRDVEQAYASYIYGDSCCGQRVIYDVGMTGIPVINVNNNCSSGSTALFLARQAIASGAVDCALAVGFEQMSPGAIGSAYPDKPDPMQKFLDKVVEFQGPDVYPAPGMFAGAAQEYMEKWDVGAELFAKISEKSRRHGSKNPNAVFRDLLSVDEVMASPLVCEPLTRFQCCPPTCGAAAAILCSDEFAGRHGINRAVKIIGQSMTTDKPGVFDGRMQLIGYDMARSAAQAVYEMSGYGAEDVDLVELHDCFTANEVMAYESLGLCPEGGSEKFITDGDNTYGGKVVTNPSGGLLAKGHPSGATGVAQCAEIVWHLRGEAGERQVENARLGLQHNIGLGGAAVVTMYQSN